MYSLSTHILDISTGTPAQGVTVTLARNNQILARCVTDDNGRISEFSHELTQGEYQLVAELGNWFRRSGRETLYTCARIDFVIHEAADAHYHLPFLIAPGGWSTYRGS